MNKYRRWSGGRGCRSSHVLTKTKKKRNKGRRDEIHRHALRFTLTPFLRRNFLERRMWVVTDREEKICVSLFLFQLQGTRLTFTYHKNKKKSSQRNKRGEDEVHNEGKKKEEDET